MPLKITSVYISDTDVFIVLKLILFVELGVERKNLVENVIRIRWNAWREFDMMRTGNYLLTCHSVVADRPLPSTRHRLSYDDCLEDKRENLS